MPKNLKLPTEAWFLFPFHFFHHRFKIFLSLDYIVNMNSHSIYRARVLCDLRVFLSTCCLENCFLPFKALSKNITRCEYRGLCLCNTLPYVCFFYGLFLQTLLVLKLLTWTVDGTATLLQVLQDVIFPCNNSKLQKKAQERKSPFEHQLFWSHAVKSQVLSQYTHPSRRTQTTSCHPETLHLFVNL